VQKRIELTFDDLRTGQRGNAHNVEVAENGIPRHFCVLFQKWGKPKSEKPKKKALKKRNLARLFVQWHEFSVVDHFQDILALLCLFL
jgi:hypothetical protein